MMTLNTFKAVSFAVVSGLVLVGCSDSSDYNFEKSIQDAREEAQQAATVSAVMDPLNAELPFPNNLLFRGSTDGTLNIPLDEGVTDTDYDNPIVALNTLDGFSTTQFLTSDFTGPVDAATATVGDSVRVFEAVIAATGAVEGITRELTAPELVVTTSGNTLVLVPTVPLKPATQYIALLTNGITDTNGTAVASSSVHQLVSSPDELTGGASLLEPLRLITLSMLGAAQGQGVDPASVVQIWGFRTQSIGHSLQALKDNTTASPLVLAATGLTTADVSAALPGIADVYIGTLDLPYYRTAPANANDPVGVSSFWQGEDGSLITGLNPLPVATSTQQVPVLMTLPNANSGNSMPAGGWPVTIFVHGITRDRSNMLAVADSYAAAGQAVIAIDQAMHGITDESNPLSATASPFPDDVERTFGLDLLDNTTGAPGPDGTPDESGAHYYSPASLLPTRDNMRQSAADLMVLSASLGTAVTAPGSPAVTLDASKKSLLGFSLGSFAGTVFLAFDDTINATTFAMPAAGLARTAIASGSFRDQIIAGLAAAGLEEGTAEFEQFLTATQTLIDSGDSINYATQAAQNSPIHMTQIVGDGADNLPDQTAPVTVPGAPLSGSDALARLMGFDPANPTTTTVNNGGLVRFTDGAHSSLLDPTSSLAVTTEIQRQAATFAATGGTLLQITDTSVIEGAN